MGDLWARWWLSIAGLVAAIVIFAVGASSASALVDPEPISKDVEIVKSALESNTTLSDFPELSAQQKLAVERVFGSLEWQNELYRGGTEGEIKTHYGLEYGSEAETGVKSIEDDLTKGTAEVPDYSSTAVDVGGEALESSSEIFDLAGVTEVDPILASGIAAFAGGYWVGERLMEVFSGPHAEGPSEGAFSLGAPIVRMKWIQGSSNCEAGSERLCTKSWSEFRSTYEEPKVDGKTYNAVEGGGCSSCGLPIMPKVHTLYALAAEVPAISSTQWLIGAMAFETLASRSHSWPYGDPQVEESVEEHCAYGFNPFGRLEGWPPRIANSELWLKGSEDVSCNGYLEYVCGEHRCVEETRLHESIEHESEVYRLPSQIPVDFPKVGRTCAEGFECRHTSVPSLSGTSTSLIERTHGALDGGGSDLEKYIDALTEGNEGRELVPGAVEELAEALVVDNPEAELTAKVATKVAEKCLKETETAGNDGVEECKDEPIFLPGEDVLTAAEHDQLAISAYPPWARLNYEKAEVKEANGEKRSWYEGEGGCSSLAPEGESCDEYPFFASAQGGPGKTPKPSLEYIVKEDNSLEGSYYSGFLSSCKVAEHGSFLVVPIVDAPTSKLCN
jgi:hypothetical protein